MKTTPTAAQAIHPLPAPSVSAPETRQAPTLNFPGVDVLRAVAAFLVLLYHVIEVGKLQYLPDNALVVVLRHGWIGVDLFLVISGFVIALSAFSGIQRHGTDFRRAFAMRRLARIVPLYLITGALYIVLIKPQYLFLPLPQILAHIISHLLFIHNLFASTHGSINGPSWSVALEMQFYLLMLFIAPWLWRASVARVLVTLLLAGLAWRFISTLIHVPGTAVPIIQFISLTQLPGTIDQFGMGIALALAVSKGKGWIQSVVTPGWMVFSGWALASTAILSAAAWFFRSYGYWNETSMLVGWRPLLGLGFACMLGAAMTLPVAGSRLFAPLRYLGTISYGIYLWHMLVLISMVSWVPGLSNGKLASGAIAATLILAALSWHLIEKPNINQYKAK